MEITENREGAAAIFARFAGCYFLPNAHLYAFWWMGVTLVLEAWHHWDYWDWVWDWDYWVWVRGASDHPCVPSLWVYLHVRPDCFMTMDYFLLLCSLLLPMVFAVEGKKSHFSFGVFLRCRMPKDDFYSEPAYPSLSEFGHRSGWGSCIVVVIVHIPKFFFFFFFSFFTITELKVTFHFLSGHLACFKRSLMALLALRSWALCGGRCSFFNTHNVL